MPEIDFYGEKFHLADEANDFAFMEFAETAERVEEDSMPAMAALFRLLRESIAANPFDDESTADTEWERFRLVARKNRATTTTLLPIVYGVYSGATERPTEQPSDSSDGPEPTVLRYVSQPADPVMERLIGRPDQAVAILQERQARSA